ncbi:uncharacterized protein LOC143592144 isoform X4 [Bidens hawaiensis]|uniref:uncharacterized protein LOC143592144 isoform X4 n=1 Tax=Bidens hawaiensis TaxID=980011 RepID=UPI00404A7B85
MKRELAFALEARSQFACFTGRTRSSEPSSVNRRNKRMKTDITDRESVNIDVLVNAEDEIVNGGGGGDESTVVAGKGNVTPKRFTRSALKEKEEEDDVGSGNRKKMELKMLEKMPTNMRGLLETGLLEGFRVCYKLEAEGANLQGVIKGVGILCSCSLCEGIKVISPSQFEMHALKSYRHAIKHIFLENGKSLLELIEICKAAASETLDVALQTVISSLPAKGLSMCTKCNGEQHS